MPHFVFFRPAFVPELVVAAVVAVVVDTVVDVLPLAATPPQAASAEAATIAEADTTRARNVKLVFIGQTLSRNLRDP